MLFRCYNGKQMACVLYLSLIFHCLCKLRRRKCLKKINHAEARSSDTNNASRQGKRRGHIKT